MMHLYSAGHARPLATRLAHLLASAPTDPMTPEWLAVPSDGMRRWVTLELAAHLGASGPGCRDGVAANIVRAYPGTLRSDVLAADRDPDDADPWSIQGLVWSVLGVADRNADDSVLSPFLDLAPGASRYANARRVADLFDRYHLHRPDMIRAWAAGDRTDGAGRTIADHAAWQPHLWTLVRRAVGEPSPPERWPDLLDRLGRVPWGSISPAASSCSVSRSCPVATSSTWSGTMTAKRLAAAANVMARDPAALQLRLLQTVVEVAGEKNSTLVMPVPVELLGFFEKIAPAAASGGAAPPPEDLGDAEVEAAEAAIEHTPGAPALESEKMPPAPEVEAAPVPEVPEVEAARVPEVDASSIPQAEAAGVPAAEAGAAGVSGSEAGDRGRRRSERPTPIRCPASRSRPRGGRRAARPGSGR